MNQIFVIDDYYCTKQNEKNHIKHLLTEDDFSKYKIFVTKNEKHLNKPVLMEYYTGDQDVKPFFDVETYLPIKTTPAEIQKNIEVLHSTCLFELEKIYLGKDIIVLTRPYRIIIKSGIKQYKISFRFIVNKLITNCTDIKKVLNNHFKDNPITSDFFDKNVYRNGSNKICMIGGVKPHNEKNDVEHMKPFELYNSSDTYSIFDMSITYIDKDFERYVCDLPVGPIEDESINKQSIKIEEISDDDDQDDKQKIQDFKMLRKYIKNLNIKRSKHYNDWNEIIMIICNEGTKAKWSEDNIADLAHEFSRTNLLYYDARSVDKKIKEYCHPTIEPKFKVGIKRLLLCLKEDNPKYYDENIIPSYAEMKVDFEKNVIVINNPLCFYRIPSSASYYN